MQLAHMTQLNEYLRYASPKSENIIICDFEDNLVHISESSRYDTI